MIFENEKRKWVSPKIEKINLEFDKEMDAACFGSNNTPSGKPACGLDPNAAHSCWNTGRQDTSNN